MRESETDDTIGTDIERAIFQASERSFQGLLIVSLESLDLLYVNQTLTEMLGLPPDYFRGKTLMDLVATVHPDDVGSVQAGLARRREGDGRPATYTVRAFRPDGETITLNILTGRVVLDSGPAFLAVFQDISSIKEAARKHQQLEDRMLQAQKLESLGVLAGGIAHDFNNLLMGVLGNAELARLQQQTGASAAEPIERIRLAALRAADLAKQLLAYSGRGQFEVQVQDINDLVGELQPLLMTSIERRAELVVSAGADLPLVEVDGTQIRQLLMNLVINAAEAMGEGPGKILVTTGREHCDRECLSETYLDDDLAEGEYVFLEVRDDGCGMGDETRKRIFDPFFTTKSTGRGLGLASVVGIVRGHHGAMSVLSESGRGSTFKILLPVADGRAVALAGETKKAMDYRGSGWVLVVDDEPSVGQVAQAMLERLGFDVEAVGDGHSALDAFRSRPDDFRLVLLDMTMPGMSGPEVLAEIRSLSPNAKVVLTSGYHEGEVVQTSTRTKPDAFLQKPYVFQDLVGLLERVL